MNRFGKDAMMRIAAKSKRQAPGNLMSYNVQVALLVSLSLGISLPTEAGMRAGFAAERPIGKPLRREEMTRIAAKVLPKKGYGLKIKWGGLGPKLVELGVIDLGKYRQAYKNDGSLSYIRYLESPSDDFITVTPANAQFLVNVFWALGLANRNPLLEKLAADVPQIELMRLASTGGWTLGKKPAEEFYSNFDIIRLTERQQTLVAELARSIYRPCCDNPTSFPDCNHGMALLGLIELMAANGYSRQDILTASLQFNAFWFPQQYVETAVLLYHRGVDWTTVDPQEVLSAQYSSSSGWRDHVQARLQKEGYFSPGQNGGSSC